MPSGFHVERTPTDRVCKYARYVAWDVMIANQHQPYE